MADSSFTEISSAQNLSVHHRLVLHGLHQGIGCDSFCASCRSAGQNEGQVLFVGRVEFDLHDETEDQEDGGALTYARDISVRLSEKLNRLISLGTPAYFRELTEKMEDLLVELMTEKDLVNSFNHCLMNEDD